MRVKLFYHSLISDWNHGNAHFLRGVAAELLERGHEVTVYEPKDGWSLENLTKEHGIDPVEEFHRRFPKLVSRFHDPVRFDPDLLRDADLVLVHEWNEPELVAAIGRHRKPDQMVLFHDTHHRSVSDPDAMARFDLSGYDGVLAFGETVKQQYLKHGWAKRAWTWHEAADTRVFYPHPAPEPEGDLVWIGNWGDEERDAELKEFLLCPIRALSLKAVFHGVRYPAWSQRELEQAGAEYRGWLPNYRVPEAFGRFRMTIHIPRRFYRESLPGIPTIRPFEAMACKIPLICAPWSDNEGLFTEGSDYLVACDGAEMRSQMQAVLRDEELRQNLVDHAHRSLHARHTCAHRVDELLQICEAPDRALTGNER